MLVFLQSKLRNVPNGSLAVGFEQKSQCLKDGVSLEVWQISLNRIMVDDRTGVVSADGVCNVLPCRGEGIGAITECFRKSVTGLQEFHRRTEGKNATPLKSINTLY